MHGIKCQVTMLLVLPHQQDMNFCEHVPCRPLLTWHRTHGCTSEAAGFELHLTERLSVVVYVVINECRNGEVRVVVSILQAIKQFGHSILRCNNNHTDNQRYRQTNIHLQFGMRLGIMTR